MKPIFRALVFLGWALMLLALATGFVALRLGGGSIARSGGLGVLIAAGIGMLFIAGFVLSRMLLPRIGRFSRQAKATYRNNYAHGSNKDLLLYLRPFSADNTFFTLPRDHEVRQKRKGADRLDTSVSLEELIVEAFSEMHRIVAIGKPDELIQPIGAQRLYSESWQKEVSDLIEEAGIIVLCLGDSSGVLWELEAVLSKEKLSNTIIVIPPGKEEEIEQQWHQWQNKMDSHNIDSRDLLPDTRLVVFSQNDYPRFVRCEDVGGRATRSPSRIELYFATLQEVVSTMRLRSDSTFLDFDEDILLELIDPKRQKRPENEFKPPDDSFEPPSSSFEPPTEWSGH